MKEKKPYTPNLKDKQVIALLERALAFTLQSTSIDKQTPLSYEKLYKHYGKRSCEWLKMILLRCTDSTFSKHGKKAMQYKRNQVGVDYIRTLLQTKKYIPWDNFNLPSLHTQLHSPTINTNIMVEDEDDQPKSYDDKTNIIYDKRVVLNMMRREIEPQLISGDISYNFKTNRYWHPFQSYKKEHRNQFLSLNNYNHSYDIETCAPTVLYQYARHINPGMVRLEAIERYLNHKDEVRRELSELTESDIKLIKIMINALFSGARLAISPSFELYQLFMDDNDKYKAPAVIMLLKENEYITQLISDIKIMWSIIEPVEYKPVYHERINKRTGEVKLCKTQLSSRKKWDVYFRLESLVGDTIKKYLAMTNNNKFFIHDGWFCMNKIDIDELTIFVKDNTGYELRFGYEYNGYNGLYDDVIDNTMGYVREASTPCVEPCPHNVHDVRSSHPSHCSVNVSSICFLEDNIKENTNIKEIISTHSITYPCMDTPPDNSVTHSVTLEESKEDRKRRLTRERVQKHRLKNRLDNVKQ